MIHKALPFLFLTVACSSANSTAPDEKGSETKRVITVQEQAVGCFHSLKQEYEWVDQGESGYTLGTRTICHAEVRKLRDLLFDANTEVENLPELLGITPQSLEQHWDQILEMALPAKWAQLGAQLPQELASTITYDRVARRIAHKLQGPTWSTDTQHFSIVIPGDPVLEVTSDVNRLWMLPWTVTMGETQWSVVDPRVPEALLKFAQPEGPCAWALDGSDYRRNGIWSNRAFWSSFVGSQALAREVYSHLPGYEAFDQRFAVDKVVVGSVNLQPDSMYFDLSPRTANLIDSIRWWNPFESGELTATWEDYLKVHSDATAALEHEGWLVEWKQGAADRTITLEAVGSVGHSEFAMDTFVDPAWADSKLQGTPEFELQLRRNGQRCGTVFLSKSESGALLTMARAPGGSNWFSDLKFSFHPRNTPPTYGFVNAAGQFELRTLSK